jgi:hypothetical protein
VIADGYYSPAGTPSTQQQQQQQQRHSVFTTALHAASQRLCQDVRLLLLFESSAELRQHAQQQLYTGLNVG